MASFRKEFFLDQLDLCGKLIGIFEESGGEGNFVVNYFIWEALREKESSCCLLTIKHAFNHYFHVGLKLGYNLLNQSSRATVLEAPRSITHNQSNQGFFSSLDKNGMKNLFLLLKTKCELLLEKYNKVFLLIDDISYFFSAGFCTRDLLTFCHYLRTLQTRNIVIVVLAHYSEKDQETMNVKCFLEQYSDIKFHVSPLRTGTAEDITGSIAMTRKISSLQQFTKDVFYHYKLSDRNIKLFPPGCI